MRLRRRNAKSRARSENADAAFREGYAARQSGNLELARTEFAKVVSLAPQIPEGHEALGAVLLELGQPADAIAELETAAKLKPGDAGNRPISLWRMCRRTSLQKPFRTLKPRFTLRPSRRTTAGLS